MIQVKICGIRNKEDALECIKLGADAIGLLVGQLHLSSDFITPEEAQVIVKEIPSFSNFILVSHSENPQEIIKFIEETGVRQIQIHSEMLVDDIKKVRSHYPNIKILKSYHVIDKNSLDYGNDYQDIVDAFVLDSINNETGQVGGTGILHDWQISAQIVKKYNIPVILAGGLTPENVKEAIEQVKPYGIDVNSGVKQANGYKDIEKVRKFINKAKFE